MNIPIKSMLKESDPSETELVNPGEYIKDPTPVQENVGSTAEGVRSGKTRSRYTGIVLLATVPAGDLERVSDHSTYRIESIDKRGDHLRISATTSAGKLFEFEVLPHEFYITEILSQKSLVFKER